MTNPQQGANVDQFASTIWSKVAEKLCSGLTDVVVDNGMKPIVLNLTGAIQTQMLAIDGNVNGWSELPIVINALQNNATSAWASQMLRERPMNVTKSGSSFVISNDVSLKTPIASNKFMTPIGQSGLRLPLGEAFMLQELKHVKFDRVFGVFNDRIVDTASTEWANLPLGTASPAVMATIVPSKDSTIYQKLDAIARTSGHTYAEDVPVLYGYTANANQSSYWSMLRWYQGTDTYNELNYVMQHIGIPGVKWLVYYFGVGCNSNEFSDLMVQAWMGSEEQRCLWQGTHPDNTVWPSVAPNGLYETPQSSIRVGQYYCIPIVDDGSSKFTLYHSILNDGGETSRAYAEYSDVRYESNTSGLKFNSASAESIMKSQYVVIGGKSLKMSEYQATNWNNSASKPGWSFLPFMVVPGLTQYMLCSQSVPVEKKYDHNGKEVTLITYDIVCTDYCTSFDYEWYVKYYTTGFGLYTPRDELSRKRVLDTWNEATELTYYLSVTSNVFTLSGLEIDDLDIRKAYKRARKKACKVDNFYELKFNDKHTWGQVRDMIRDQGSFSSFLSANTGYNAPLAVKTAQEYTYWIEGGRIEITDSNGVKTIHDMDEEGIVKVFSTCRNYPKTVEKCVSEFGVDIISDWGTFLTSMSDFQEEIKNPYLSYNPCMKGRQLAENYFFPWESLGMSGYPVYRAMNLQARTIMVARQVSQLDKQLKPFMKILNSFTTEAVIEKLKL